MSSLYLPASSRSPSALTLLHNQLQHWLQQAAGGGECRLRLEQRPAQRHRRCRSVAPSPSPLWAAADPRVLPRALSGNRKPFLAPCPCPCLHTAHGETYSRCTADASSRPSLARREHEDTLGGRTVQMPPRGKLGGTRPSSLFFRNSGGDPRPARGSVAAVPHLFT